MLGGVRLRQAFNLEVFLAVRREIGDLAMKCNSKIATAAAVGSGSSILGAMLYVAVPMIGDPTSPSRVSSSLQDVGMAILNPVCFVRPPDDDITPEKHHGRHRDTEGAHLGKALSVPSWWVSGVMAEGRLRQRASVSSRGTFWRSLR